jgi:hypothetical protein
MKPLVFRDGSCVGQLSTGTVPNAGMHADGHVADDNSGFGEVCAPAELRRFPQKFIELFHRMLHAENLTADDGDVADGF